MVMVVKAWNQEQQVVEEDGSPHGNSVILKIRNSVIQLFIHAAKDMLQTLLLISRTNKIPCLSFS